MKTDFSKMPGFMVGNGKLIRYCDDGTVDARIVKMAIFPWLCPNCPDVHLTVSTPGMDMEIELPPDHIEFLKTGLDMPGAIHPEDLHKVDEEDSK